MLIVCRQLPHFLLMAHVYARALQLGHARRLPPHAVFHVYGRVFVTLPFLFAILVSAGPCVVRIQSLYGRVPLEATRQMLSLCCNDCTASTAQHVNCSIVCADLALASIGAIYVCVL